MNSVQNYQFKNNTSFGSAIPVRVFVNGKVATEEKLVKGVMDEFRSIVTSSASKRPDIKSKFMDYVNDFLTPVRGEAKDQCIRTSMNLLDNVVASVTLFTGKHARNLHEIGKKLGKAKGRSNKIFGSPYATSEVSGISKEYHSTINNFKKNPQDALVHNGVIKDGISKGEPLQLCTYTKNGGANIDSVAFESASKSVMDVKKPQNQLGFGF